MNMNQIKGRSQSDFKDILAERRQEISHLPWVNRKLDLLKSYMPEKKILPSWHKSTVESSKKVLDIVAKINREYNVPEVVVLNHIRNILNEIGYNKSVPTLRTLAYVLTKICTTVCRGIYVNVHSVQRMKLELGQANTPVLYLPSHRSYADFILMSYVLFTLNIEIPAIAAGMDFYGMVGMGKVLRDTGAFFMRRSYNSDNLYWDIFRQYVSQIITSGNTGIEFFIEGTRSRSGKSLSPKFGLLSMILKSFLTGEIYNLLIVPINISYERVMEENLFAFELLGVPKPAESTSGFLKALKIINEDFGNVYIDFGAPISIRELFANRIERSQHVLKPIHLQEFTDKERSVISDLAEQIVNYQQNMTVVTTFNLIAIILSEHLVTSNLINLPLNVLISEVLWFCSMLKVANVVTPVINEQSVIEALKVHKNLVSVDEIEKTVCLNKVNITLDGKYHAKMKGHVLSNDTMTAAIPVVKLQIYVNPVLHYLVDAALVVIILSNRSNITKYDLLKDFEFLRKFLAKDFVFPRNSISKRFDDAILFLTTNQCIDTNTESNSYLTLKESKLIKFLVNLINPFLFTNIIVCNVLLETAIQPCSEKAIFVNCQSKLEELGQQQFVHPYCLNLDGLSNCRSTLLDMNCLNMITKSGNRFYSVDAVNMNTLLSDLSLILGNQKYKLHVNNKL